MSFDPDLPIVLGLSGQRATGKTTVANAIAPGRVSAPKDEMDPDKAPPIIWDHYAYALPIKRMATARRVIEGEKAYDRMAYEIHATLVDVFGNNPLYGAPSYDELVEMVYRILELPFPKSGKSRSFQQQVGTEILRAYDEDVWVKWMRRKVQKEFLKFKEEYEDSDAEPYFGAVISDCRFPNEAEFVRTHPNGVLVRFTASPSVIAERERERDGHTSTDEQKTHASETSADLIPEEWYDAIIDTDNVGIAEQVNKVKEIVALKTGLTI